MKKLALILVGLVVLACVPSVPSVQSSSFLGNPDPMSVACATGFTRIQPHFCKINSSSSSGLIMDNTCRSINFNTTWGVPLTATAVLNDVLVNINTNNAAGVSRRALTKMFTASNCLSGQVDTVDINAREQVATVAAALMGYMTSRLEPLATNAIIYYTSQSVDGASHSVFFQVNGYYD